LAEPVLVGIGPGAGDPRCDHRHLTARARVVVEQVGGVDRVIECWGEPPLLPRQTAVEVCFVGSAAGPLGGDVLSTTLEVGAGARLAVGTVAATYARPGASGEESVATVGARVGRGGRLSWTPEPLVAVSGCRHRAETVLHLAEGAELFWAEVTVLGRYGEVGGDVWVRRSVDLAGRPLSRQEVAMVAADRTRPDPAVLGEARVVASCLVVHPEWHPDPTGGEPPARSELPALVATGATRAGVLHLAGPAAEIVGLGQSVDDVLAAFGVLADRMAESAPSTAAALAGYVARMG
jgi:urease accessory protein